MFYFISLINILSVITTIVLIVICIVKYNEEELTQKHFFYSVTSLILTFLLMFSWVVRKDNTSFSKDFSLFNDLTNCGVAYNDESLLRDTFSGCIKLEQTDTIMITKTTYLGILGSRPTI